MKRQKIKKIAKVIPAAFVLSSALFVAPGFSSADSGSALSKSPKSERVTLVNADGQKLASTEQTPDFTSLIPLPKHPNDLFPSTSYNYVKDGNIVDYLYYDTYAKETQDVSDRYNTDGYALNKQVLQEGSIVVLPDGKVVHGEDNKIVTITKDGYTIKDSNSMQNCSQIDVVSFNKGQHLYTVGLSKQYINSEKERVQYFGNIDAKVKAEYRWDLISQDLIGKDQGMSLAHQVTFGMSHEVKVGLSYTLGMEVGLEGVATVNQSVTASLDYNFRVSEERTETRTFNYNPIHDYRYPYYRGAIYQGKVKYTVVPNEKFKQYINDGNLNVNLSVPGTENRFKGEQELPVNMFAIVNSQ